ncbi:hypothetical protein Mgra_00004575, partial [Meloidogyne graminicola]
IRLENLTKTVRKSTDILFYCKLAIESNKLKFF